MSEKSSVSKLHRMIAGSNPCITIVTFEEAHALSILRKAQKKEASPRDVAVWSVIGGLREGMSKSAKEDPNTENPAAALYTLLKKASDQTVAVMLDLAAHLKDDRVLRLTRDLIHRYQDSDGTLVLIDQQADIPPVIRAYATEFEIELPDLDEVRDIVLSTLRKERDQGGIEIDIKKAEFQAILKNLRGLTRRNVRDIVKSCVVDDRNFKAEDLNHILAVKRHSFHSDGLLEYIETPATLAEVGGLHKLKAWLNERQALTVERAAKYGLSPPRGLLLLGVQGAGKSICAKAIATAWGQPLLRLDPGVLYDRYIGESERRLRSVLHQAELMAPLVLWIDEIEKGFASAAARSTDGGLSQRMFGTLLTWMQDHQAPVFLVATANNIDALPPELLRKGRFDEIFFVDLPDWDARKEIFAIHIGRRNHDLRNLDADRLVQASDGYTGAEIEAAVIAAAYTACAADTELSTDHILASLTGSPPLSVTMAEKVQELRIWAQARCVPAS